MFKKILLPLDGSAEAETVFPYVRDIASRFNSEVDALAVGLGNKRRRVNYLLQDYVHHAVERLQRHDITCHAVVIYRSSAEELVDYTEITKRNHNLKAKGTMLYGGPADNILQYIKQHRPDLVIMATHGRGGLTRWWLGSVSEKIVSQSEVPVLLIHSKHAQEIDNGKRISFKHILAPLDGSEIGEAALSDAIAIASKTGATISLLHVIPEPHAVEAKMLGEELGRVSKAMHTAGEDYLEKICTQVSKEGINVTARIVEGDPAECIIELAQHDSVDLIAMATHGRSGMARWVLGSVADKVLHASKLPMWLVRPQKIINAIHPNVENNIENKMD